MCRTEKDAEVSGRKKSHQIVQRKFHVPFFSASAALAPDRPLYPRLRWWASRINRRVVMVSTERRHQSQGTSAAGDGCGLRGSWSCRSPVMDGLALLQELLMNERWNPLAQALDRGKAGGRHIVWWQQITHLERTGTYLPTVPLLQWYPSAAHSVPTVRFH